MATKTVVREWGSSLGVVFPAEFVRQNRLKSNDRVLIQVVKEADLTTIFGSLKRKMSGQEFKNMVRKQW